MKKILSLLLALLLLSGLLPATAEAPATAPNFATGETPATSNIPADAPDETQASATASAAASKPAALKPGDVVEGFELKETRSFALIGARLYAFEHQKTGAKLLYIANADPNRAFQLTFPTRASSDMGIAHVFEHATLCGSEKYPSGDLWMNAAYQTYHTYMNAYTTDATTCYPVASLSEAQLLKLADLYTDLCLHPLIMTDESIFRQEAWRYELTDPSAPLTLNGTVYSEMKGALNLNEAGLYAANKITFPGASISYNYGGDPEAIPRLSWEEVKAYHDRYYHPSNCVAFLYGALEDYAAFLRLLNAAFSDFDRREMPFILDEPAYTPITAPAETTFRWPTEEGGDAADQSAVYYYILCPGMKGDAAQESLMDHACSLMSDPASALMQALRSAFPAASFSVGREMAGPDDAVGFMAFGVGEEDADRFRRVVDAAVAETVRDGFPPELTDSVAVSLNFEARLTGENANPVETVLESFSYLYAVTGDLFSYVDYYEALSRIGSESREGLLTDAVSRWLTAPALYTLSTAVPVPGLKEEREAERAAALAEIKAAMTEEEIEALVARTTVVPPDDDTSAMIADLTAVTVATLPEELREYEIRDTVAEDGTRRLEAVAGLEGVLAISLNLDAAALPQEDLHFLRLFTRLLGSMPTPAHSWQELTSLLRRDLFGGSFGVLTAGWKNDFHPYLSVNWYALDENMAAGYALAEEILFETRFTDTALLLERVQAERNSIRAEITQSPYQVLLFRQLGLFSPLNRYYSYLNHLDYYEFLSETESLLRENPSLVQSRLEAVQRFFQNRAGAVSTAAGGEASLALARPLTDAFFAKLESVPRPPVAYALPAPAKREALIVDAAVGYATVAVNWLEVDPEADGAAFGPLADLLTDRLLIPLLRDAQGVYTPVCESKEDLLYLMTYRDPKVAETFSFFDSLPDRIAALAVDQSALDGYILNTYSALAKPAGELSGAAAALNNRLSGLPDDLPLRHMRTLKALTPAALKTFAEELKKALSLGVRGAVGPASEIRANASLFDEILNPFDVRDLSAASFADVPEGHEWFEAVRSAVSQGLMTPDGENVFGVDRPSTVGELLSGLYRTVSGVPGDPETVRETFAGLGLVPADQDLSAPLSEGLFCRILSEGFEADLSTDTPDRVIPRGELADLLVSLFE